MATLPSENGFLPEIQRRGLVFTPDGPKMLSGAALFHDRLERLLLRGEGGFLGRPNEGSLIPSFLQDPADDANNEDISSEVEFQLRTYEPDIEEALITVRNDQQQPSGVIIEISGKVDTGEQLDELRFFGLRDTGAAGA